MLKDLPFRDCTVGNLGRQLLVGDFTVVHPLLDALRDDRREDDARHLQALCADLVVQCIRTETSKSHLSNRQPQMWRRERWRAFAETIEGFLFADLYDVGAAMAVVERVLDPRNQPTQEQVDAERTRMKDNARALRQSRAVMTEVVDGVVHEEEVDYIPDDEMDDDEETNKSG